MLTPSEAFVRVSKNLPDTKNVTGTNFCDISARFDERARRLILLSAEDNLVKGAAGQAVQNFNLMAGLDETAGLFMSQYKKLKGGVCAPKGFVAGAIGCGIKTGKVLREDLAVVLSEIPAASAATFTTNVVKAAPVLLSAEHLKAGKVRAIVLNSGNANACTGKDGLAALAQYSESHSRTLRSRHQTGPRVLDRPHRCSTPSRPPRKRPRKSRSLPTPAASPARRPS